MPLYVVLALAAVAATSANDENPIGKVIQMLSGLEAKITAEGDEAKKMHDQYSEWCDDRKANVGFDIKTGKSEVESLSASIEKQSALISSFGTKQDELASSIATDEADLKAAMAVRADEAASFAAEAKELSEVIDTLDRAIAVLSRHAALLQSKSVSNVAQALEVMVGASALSTADASRLTALVQSSQDSEDGDAGAPDAAVYEQHSGGIVSVLQGLQDKAVGQQADARKAEMTSAHNFAMLKQSLDDSVGADSKDMDEAKRSGSESAEIKAKAEGDLAVSSKDLAADTKQLGDLGHDCKAKAEDYEAEAASRAEELKALANAKKVIQEATGGAEKQTYGLDQMSFVQRSRLSSSADLSQFEVVHLVQDLAKKENSAALAQLSSQIAAAIRFTAGDPFVKIKGLISDMIARLESQGSAEASHKEYCDKELKKTNEKKADKFGDVEKLSTKIDQMTAKSAHLKERAAEHNKQLAAVAHAQAGMDKMRQSENAAYKTDKAELEQGIQGVQTALKVLRDYYAADGAHDAAGGAGAGIIGLLEVVESDFTKGLAEMVSTEDAAATSYARATQENEVETTEKSQDVKFESQEASQLDKAVAEAKSDRSGAQDELDANLEYLAKLKDQCVAKAEPYAERKARREAEIAGLRQALEILEGQAALVQTKSVHRHA